MTTVTPAVPGNARAAGRASRRMNVVIVVMLLIILVPVTIVSQPLSKIVVSVSNAEAQKTASVSIIVYGTGGNGRFDFYLSPGETHEVSCAVVMGEHDVRVRYWFSGQVSNDQWIWEKYSLWPFEVERAKFQLVSPLSAVTSV